MKKELRLSMENKQNPGHIFKLKDMKWNVFYPNAQLRKSLPRLEAACLFCCSFSHPAVLF